jgi:cell division topological specificity factor
VVRKYVPVDQSQIKVHLDREGGYEVLELNITLPDEEPRSKRGPESRSAPGQG